MSLKYGLNVKKTGPPPLRKTILDEDDDEEEGVQSARNEEAAVEEISSFGGNATTIPPRKERTGATQRAPPAPPASRKLKEDFQDPNGVHTGQARAKAAQEVDPSIFDYDSFHDAKSTVTEAKKAAARQEAVERKPKYINNLLDAASRRKQDQQIAREKLLQKEREAEGDEFADKEKFVTGAYKEQQEETRKLEEEEKRKAEQEEKRKRQLGGGMQGFYKGMMDQQERQHQEALEAAEMLEKTGGANLASEQKQKSDAELAAELKAKGVNVHVNEEGQVTDKRELLSAGLNVAPSGKSENSHGADHLRTSARPAQSSVLGKNDGGRQAQRERQSRMMEEQLAAQAKRAREEEEEERLKIEKAAKTTKTGKDVNDAKARYLARKAAKERGEP